MTGSQSGREPEEAEAIVERLRVWARCFWCRRWKF